MEKKTNDKKKTNNKRLLTAAVVLTVMLAVSIPAAAWFSNQRGIVTMTKIQSPAALSIGAGNQESCAYIDMSGIDVTDPEVTSKDFVFCVYSRATTGNSYMLQLAHTTNIAFTYKIYRAEGITDSEGNPVDTAAAIRYFSESEGKDYYYTKSDSTPVGGAYLNKADNAQIADDSRHSDTYGEYANVQKNAEPLYWQSEKCTARMTENGFVDYYILEVSWDPAEVENNKETDMVYITAGMVN